MVANIASQASRSVGGQIGEYWCIGIPLLVSLARSVLSDGTLTRARDELNSLRTALDAASSSKRQLETQIRKSEETVDRLQQANDILSAKTLSMAEDAENARETLQRKVQDELSEMKRKLEEAQEEADEGRTRGQAQRIQLLDEVGHSQWKLSLRTLVLIVFASSTRSKRRMRICASSYERRRGVQQSSETVERAFGGRSC